MIIKSVLFTGALALSSMTIAYAKSYDISLANPVQAGNVRLKAGDYTLKLKGNNAVFIDNETAKSFTAPVKLENDAAKHPATTLETDKKGDVEELQKIELGGSTTTLEFAE